MLRDFDVVFVGLLLIQALGVVALGYVLWFHMLARYQATTVASFSFLTPILSALLGWLLLSEPVAPSTPVALLLPTLTYQIYGQYPRTEVTEPMRPRAAAWGEFNPEYFFQLDGTRLGGEVIEQAA